MEKNYSVMMALDVKILLYKEFHMTTFSSLSIVKKLLDMSKTPLDLTKDGVISQNRIDKMSAKACGYELLFATERVDEEVVSSLLTLAEDTFAIGKMKDMQKGEVVNTIDGVDSENRRVLHSSCRDFFGSPISDSAVAKDAASRALSEIEKLKTFLEDIGDKFTDVIQVGIGGSDLGPRSLYMALQPYRIKGRRLHFISNIDPDDAYAVLDQVDLSKTLIVSVSKSGTTLETLTNEEIVTKEIIAKGLNPKDHIVAVTQENSPMDDNNRYLSVFYIWDYIGGRFSATSTVGAVSLSFALGMDNFMKVLEGANAMDRVATGPAASNLPLLSALIGIWNRNFLGHDTVAIVPYSQALHKFTSHLQQCIMESNGKSIDKSSALVDYMTSPIIWGEIGTNCQHSFFQLLHQGTTIVPVEFIGYKLSQYGKDRLVKDTYSQEKLLSNLFAQSLALAQGSKNTTNPNKNFDGNRPNHILLGQQLTPYSMGALLSYYENKTALQGFIWGINSFDQEGVQLGKLLANKVLSLFSSKRNKDQSDNDFMLGQAFLKKLDEV
jgi:glucose-6-phosphate isomerase